jgi:hypothetical protein
MVYPLFRIFRISGFRVYPGTDPYPASCLRRDPCDPYGDPGELWVV